MTELLVVKIGEEYIRFAENGVERCQMNKASVFPLDKIKEVLAACARVFDTTDDVKLMKLTITEEPYVVQE